MVLVLMLGWVRERWKVVHPWGMRRNDLAVGVGLPDFRSEWRLRAQRHHQWALMSAMVAAVSTETRAEVDSLNWKAHEEVEEEQEAGH